MVKVFFTGLWFLCTVMTLTAQNFKSITNFGTIKAIVDSNHFEMEYTIATTHHTFYLQPTTPYSDQNIRIAEDSAFIIIKDSIAAGYLPYFGSGYSIPQTGSKAIVFRNKIQNLVQEYRGKGKRQSIFYQFSVVGKNDTYKLSIDIRHNGICYLFINSLNRSPISYTGQIVEKIE